MLVKISGLDLLFLFFKDSRDDIESDKIAVLVGLLTNIQHKEYLIAKSSAEKMERLLLSLCVLVIFFDGITKELATKPELGQLEPSV
ncbi:hypothetical protein DPMN_094186 [Dreissena polymorpha]|uniref:Uncharacterized protein n=1 Tax=Dreissena polymorpha TaxID=45954 RepID=A0A9D4R2M4_DREPO|nr:hypothetical protein DPMN_094186 [Dreissena polymorpha]